MHGECTDSCAAARYRHHAYALDQQRSVSAYNAMLNRCTDANDGRSRHDSVYKNLCPESDFSLKIPDVV